MGVTWAMLLLKQGYPEPFAQLTCLHGFKSFTELHWTHCSALVWSAGEV